MTKHEALLRRTPVYIIPPSLHTNSFTTDVT
jgi:hypothetical protein